MDVDSTDRTSRLELAAICEPTDSRTADVPSIPELLDGTRGDYEVVRRNGFTALLRRPEPSTDQRELRQRIADRHRLLSELARCAPTVPVQWGTQLPSEDWIVRRLERRGDELRSELRRLDGCCERTLRIARNLESSDGSHSDGSADSGRAYLQKRRREMVRDADGDPLAERWRTHCHPLASDLRMRLVPQGECAWFDAPHLEVSLLVARARQPELLTRLRERADASDAPKLALTDPMPPYSFVELDWT